MHIKTGTWEASNTVCESDTLCDPAVLVATTNPEPHIRNRRLSPGSGGGGGGGCISGGESRHLSPGADLNGATSHVHAFSFRREKERKGPQHKGRSLRREDSPAKLQPAVSYASKVKAKTASGILEDDRPAIGVLLQNQWGLSFISETRPAAPESPNPHPAAPDSPAPQVTDTQAPVEPPLAIQPPQETTRPFTTSTAPATHSELDEHNGELLLSCRHLMEALNFHNREWNAICNQQKKDPKRVVWYKDFREHPA